MISGVMWKNLPDLRKMRNVQTRFLFFLFFTCLFLTGVFLSAQSSYSVPNTVRWYRSNYSGIAIELVPSKLTAQRNEYCLSAEKADPGFIPDILVSHYNYSYTAELRILYENRKEIRRQWIFRDNRQTVRLSSSGSPGFFGEENSGGRNEKEEIRIEGFIEIRNNEGLITRELRYEEDKTEWEFLYSYTNGSLLSAETRLREPLVVKTADKESETEDEAAKTGEFTEDSEEVHAAVEQKDRDFILICTDYYRYSRPGSIRAIERVIANEAEGVTRIPFPRLGFSSSTVEEIVIPRIAYVPDFLLGVYTGAGKRINYTIDSRGRILTEVWQDEDGRHIGEILNTWEGDRLASILWKSGEQAHPAAVTLLVEYEYDSGGNRVAERNFRQGILERSVTNRGGLDIEEVYMNGKLMLRAVWEKGLKKSEERISPSGGYR